MDDLKDPRILYLKAALFLALGLLAGGILLAGHPDPWAGAFLGLTVWAFARAYFFVFYVIEHYIDPGYRFRGLIDFLAYLRHRRPAPALGSTTSPGPRLPSPELEAEPRSRT